MSLSPLSSAAQAHSAAALKPDVARSAQSASQPAPVKVQPVAATPDLKVAATAQTDNATKAAQDASLTKAVDAINRFINPVASSIQFSVDEDSGRTLVKVIDTDNNTVLRQFPSKEALAISHELDKLQGLLLKDKA